MRWRKLRLIQVVALAGSVLAAGTVLVMFNGLSGLMGRTKAQPQLIADIDLRIGNTVLAAQRGEAQARIDIESGMLVLRSVGLWTLTQADQAKVVRLKKRYGITWVNRGDVVSPESQAYEDGYHRVMRAEIVRRHDQAFLERLMREEVPASPTQTQAGRR